MKTNDATKTILRNLPESFWDVTCWDLDGEGHVGDNLSIDVADRRRIVEKILSMAGETKPSAPEEKPSTSGEWGYVCRADEMGYW